MKSFATLKKEARASLKGKWTSFVLVTLLMLIINCALSLPSTITGLMYPNSPQVNWSTLFTVVVSLIYAVLEWGFAIMFLRNLRDPHFDELGTLFDGFRDFGRIFVTLFLQNIYTLLWALLLIIPGIVKSYSYAMTPYILYDDPKLQGNAAIELSMRMMRGHKLELFLLHLSFIGWLLLCILTLGIGFLWLIPYVHSTQAAFYEDVKEEYLNQMQEDIQSVNA